MWVNVSRCEGDASKLRLKLGEWPRSQSRDQAQHWSRTRNGKRSVDAYLTGGLLGASHYIDGLMDSIEEGCCWSMEFVEMVLSGWRRKVGRSGRGDYLYLRNASGSDCVSVKGGGRRSLALPCVGASKKLLLFTDQSAFRKERWLQEQAICQDPNFNNTSITITIQYVQ